LAVKKNILLLSSEFPPQPGGIGEHAYNLARIFHHAGFQVTVLTNSRGEYIGVEERFDAGLPFQVRRVFRHRFALVTYVKRVLDFFNLLLKNPRCIVLASGKFSLWMGALGRSFFSKNIYLGVVHGTEINSVGPLAKWLTLKSLAKFKKLVAVSKFTQNLLLKACPNAQVVVINNGFDPKKFGTSSPRSLTPTLLSIGNVSRRKGQHNVVQALPLLQLKFPQIHYHIAGIPTERERVERLSEQLKVSTRVTFHDVLDNQAVSELLQDSNILMQLSENTTDGDVEGFGIAILEANAVGLPAIGSKGCGIEDAIRDGFSGRLVEAHNPQEILEAVQEIFENYQMYAANARVWAAEFTWEKRGQAYIDLVERLPHTT
jgi:phosphatidylinositol alpha-1,6-mannosyltransferase